MLRCAIVEDSPRELEHLKECLARYSAERDIPLETTAFGDAASFLEHYRADYDIVFMDIELPGINGMEAAHRLREIDQQGILIFVTNSLRSRAMRWMRWTTSSSLPSMGR